MTDCQAALKLALRKGFVDAFGIQLNIILSLAKSIARKWRCYIQPPPAILSPLCVSLVKLPYDAHLCTRLVAILFRCYSSVATSYDHVYSSHLEWCSLTVSSGQLIRELL